MEDAMKFKTTLRTSSVVSAVADWIGKKFQKTGETQLLTERDATGAHHPRGEYDLYEVDLTPEDEIRFIWEHGPVFPVLFPENARLARERNIKRPLGRGGFTPA